MTFHEKLQALEKAVKDLSKDRSVSVTIHMIAEDTPPDDYIGERSTDACEHCQPIRWFAKEFSPHYGITLHPPPPKE